jgi:hypothetical protein
MIMSLRSSTAANRATKPAPSVLQTLPRVLNASRKAKRSANTPSFPSPAVQEESSLQHGYPIEGSADGPFKYPYMFPGSDKVYEGKPVSVSEMRKVRSDTTSSKRPDMTGIDKENEGRATAMGKMPKNSGDTAPSKRPSMASIDKENGGRATAMAMGDNKASRNALECLPKDQQFFGALLLSSVNEFVDSHLGDEEQGTLGDYLQSCWAHRP